MVKESLVNENYIQEKVIINIIWANIFGIIVFIIALVIFGILFAFLWNVKFAQETNLLNIPRGNILQSLLFFFIYMLILIIGIILHELIHGIVFARYAKNKYKSIKFGIMPKEKLFSPYCHCKEILRIDHYKMAIIMPTIILGIIPAVISLIIGNIMLLFFGIVFICAGGGDILMLMKILKEKNSDLVYDLPDEAGFIVYREK